MVTHRSERVNSCFGFFFFRKDIPVLNAHKRNVMAARMAHATSAFLV